MNKVTNITFRKGGLNPAVWDLEAEYRIVLDNIQNQNDFDISNVLILDRIRVGLCEGDIDKDEINVQMFEWNPDGDHDYIKAMFDQQGNTGNNSWWASGNKVLEKTDSLIYRMLEVRKPKKEGE